MNKNKNQYQAWLSKQSNGALMCRDSGIRHSWVPYTAKRIKGGFEEVLDCPRCGTKKIRTLDKKGGLVKTNYSYDPDFKRDGMGRITKEENAEIRLRSLNSRVQ